MPSVEELMSLGILRANAERILNNEYFHKKGFSIEKFNKWIQNTARIYSCKEKEILNAITRFPAFAGYNHERVIKKATEVYGNREAVKQAILKFPSFVGLNHERVLKQATTVGKLIGISRKTMMDAILKNPVLAGYSMKRNLAAVDASRNAIERIGIQNLSPEEAFAIYLKQCSRSPYPVKGRKSRETVLERTTEIPFGKQSGTPIRRIPTISKFGKRFERILRKKLV